MTWRREKILIVGKTYPVPSREYIETVCTGGVSESGEWRRLHPIPFRYLADDKKFPVFSWIDVEVERFTPDARIISHRIRSDLLQVTGYMRDWEERRAVLQPLMSPHLEALEIANEADCWAVSMGIVEATYERFHWEEVEREWTGKQKDIMAQELLFGESRLPLAKVPYKLKLKFRCKNNPECAGHDKSILAWEVNQAFLGYRARYGSDDAALGHLKSEFERRYSGGERDLYVMVGTMKDRPKVWTIGGLFDPPRSSAAQSLLGF